jgi:YHS domain-containing protein
VKRLLIALAFFTVAVYVLRRFAGLFAPDGSRAAPRSGRDRRPPATELVRDKICDTFLPRDAALSLSRAGQMHYFCSEACRAKHLAGLGALAEARGTTEAAS